MEMVLPGLFTALAWGGTYALLGLGFSIIYQASKVINLAQGEFAMLGGLVLYALFVNLRIPLPLAVPVAIIVGVVASIALLRLLIQPLLSTNLWRQSPTFSMILLTLGATFIFGGIARIFWGTDVYPVRHFFGSQPLHILGASIVPQNVFILVLTFVVLSLILVFFRYTTLGKAMMATADNRLVASLMGINTNTIILLAFSLSGALGALGGIAFAPLTQMSSGSGHWFLFKGVVAALVGGLGNIYGPVLGGLALGAIEVVVRLLLPAGPLGQLADAIVFGGVMVMFLVRPTGLAGGKAG